VPPQLRPGRISVAITKYLFNMAQLYLYIYGNHKILLLPIVHAHTQKVSTQRSKQILVAMRSCTLQRLTIEF
jgi:hypothetical protein